MSKKPNISYRLFEVVTNDIDENKDDEAALIAADCPKTAAEEAARNCVSDPWAIFEIGMLTGSLERPLPFLVRGPYSCTAINRLGWINHVEET